MNREVYHEGWLIKSPPTKRIWRARWRRRWFTLKQGEIPGQFCLEYYTDRNCRKLKGIIDLDQCEQVDSGLKLEHRKQKFQFMFDIKTPRRIYYLAADTANDMRDWVNCICQVCNLHDFTKQNDKQYYNLCKNRETLQNEPANISLLNTSPDIQLTSTSTASYSDAENQIVLSNMISQTEQISINNTYQNNDVPYVNADYPKKESSHNTISMEQACCIERSQSFRHNAVDKHSPITPHHMRAQSLNEQLTSKPPTKTLTAVKKIPENLVLNDTNFEGSVEPSPALSTSSGPYIPISECFSGSLKFLGDEYPTTPLNNLDPKFYDTPRSHNNIGLNLTNDQSSSPKINNCPVRPRSGRSSPTDSESVFTDDEEWDRRVLLKNNLLDRNMRPSESSVENDSIIFTYTQRFSKVPKEENITKMPNTNDTISEKNDKEFQTASINGVNEKKFRDIYQFSDTENTSPAIGPKDSSSCVEESYDIPRSHHLPYFNVQQFKDHQLSPLSLFGSSTPNLMSYSGSMSSSLNNPINRPHFYTNAAPTTVEGNVFRYDFVDQVDVPPVNRNLKPKLSLDEDQPLKSPIHGSFATIDKKRSKPPSVDRKLKPTALKSLDAWSSTSSARRHCAPISLLLPSDTDFLLNPKDSEARTLPRSLSGTMANRTTLDSQKSQNQLQYFDLDTTNPPPTINRTSSCSNSVGNPGIKFGLSLDVVERTPKKSSVVYNSVDFIKTEAFKRVREDAEKSRMKE